MITQPNFTWHLHSDDLKVNALKFPTAKGIRFDKDLTLNGINSFNGNVRLLDFEVGTGLHDLDTVSLRRVMLATK